jgi:hypothetical protein
MQPAKRRRGRSAMRILINDKPVDALTPKQEKSFMLAHVEPEVKAAVFTPAEATEFYVTQTRRWFRILGGIALVLMAAIAIAGVVGDPMDGGMIAIGAVIIGAAFGLFMYLLLGHRVRTWNHKLQHRSEGLPPAGTAIFLDAKGLSVGSDIFAWPSLTNDQVDLTRSTVSSGETSTVVHIVERLSLLAGTKTIVLDRAMLQNGLLLVDNAWRKLRS